MENTALSNVNDIVDMFPHIPRSVIVADLEMTFNSEQTINRILDGQISASSIETTNVPFADNLDSDEDLPDLKSGTEVTMTESSQVKFSVRKTNSDKTSTNASEKKFNVIKSGQRHYSVNLDTQGGKEKDMKRSQQPVTKVRPSVHDISDSSDDDELNRPGLLERLTQIKNKVTSHKEFLSDNSDIDDCLPVECHSGSNAAHYKPDNFTHVNIIHSQSSIDNSNPSSSQCSAVLKGSSQEFSGHHLGSQISVEDSQVSPGNKGKRGKKRTVEEIEDSKKKAQELKKKKDEEKLRKQQERELKKREQEYEKQKRKNLLEARKQAKPGECLKFMTAVLSPGILKESSGAAILDTIQKAGIKYDIQQQIHDNIITMWREVSEVKEIEPMKLETVTREKVEDCILMLLPISKFVSLVHTYKQKQQGLTNEEDLHEHILKIKESLEGRDVTVIVQGLEKYFRDQKTKENRAFKNQVQNREGHEAEQKKRKKKQESVVISRLDIEETLVHLQLMDGCNIRFADQDQEVAKMVQQYVKAVAERPFKQDRLQTGFTFHLDSSGSASVDKEGNGLAKVWRLQLQQFPLVTAEVANTIIAAYPSPLSICKAYQNCDSERQAERLLENLEVRRGAGVMATTRRVGKELSRRLYQFFTSSDPDFVIL